MADVSPHDMARKLLSDGFERSATDAGAWSDPIADTPMTVTLDELRPYELDPRITRNPLYSEIKASIRERGLDAPPPITRRPGADHYIIRNGGNTRLAILRELWTETKEERFFRIACLFRPWSDRGEIVALTGHLAENELHGGLSFIERALGVEKVRELYEQEDGKPLSQSELARRLKADGYPVPQPHISRMQEAIHYLLPAIPTVLYGGLGRHQVEHLTALRRTGARIWEARSAAKDTPVDFDSMFQNVLAAFDLGPGDFDVERVHDELIGQMADHLGEKYDTIAFEFTVAERRIVQPLNTVVTDAGPLPVPPAGTSPVASPSPQRLPAPSPQPPREDRGNDTARDGGEHDDLDDDGQGHEKAATPFQAHIVEPAAPTDRLQSIQRLVADHLGEDLEDFESNVLKAVPVQAGGLYPISDIWHIDPGLDEPERLRVHIAQFAREIADEAGMADWIDDIEHGIGFGCAPNTDRHDIQRQTPLARAILALLHTLSAPYNPDSRSARIETIHLVRDLGPLLQGWAQPPSISTSPGIRLSDSGLVKLFRLIRLARRLLELETQTADGDDASPGS